MFGCVHTEHCSVTFSETKNRNFILRKIINQNRIKYIREQKTITKLSYLDNQFSWFSAAHVKRMKLENRIMSDVCHNFDKQFWLFYTKLVNELKCFNGYDFTLNFAKKDALSYFVKIPFSVLFFSNSHSSFGNGETNTYCREWVFDFHKHNLSKGRKSCFF